MSLPRDFKLGDKIIIQHRPVPDQGEWADMTSCEDIKSARSFVENCDRDGQFRMMRRSDPIVIQSVKRRVASMSDIAGSNDDPHQTTTEDQLDGSEPDRPRDDSEPRAITRSSATA